MRVNMTVTAEQYILSEGEVVAARTDLKMATVRDAPGAFRLGDGWQAEKGRIVAKVAPLAPAKPARAAPAVRERSVTQPKKRRNAAAGGDAWREF